MLCLTTVRKLLSRFLNNIYSILNRIEQTERIEKNHIHSWTIHILFVRYVLNGFSRHTDFFSLPVNASTRGLGDFITSFTDYSYGHHPQKIKSQREEKTWQSKYCVFQNTHKNQIIIFSHKMPFIFELNGSHCCSWFYSFAEIIFFSSAWLKPVRQRAHGLFLAI